jgi:hypothetical protein
MIDFNSLPLISKVVLIAGFTIGIMSFILFLRYPIMLILMKYSPEYREFIKRTIERKKEKINEKNNFRNR